MKVGNNMNNLLQAQANLSVEMPSLKALAAAFETFPTRLTAVAKKPIVGETYNPDSINYDALCEYLEKKLEDGQTFESKILEAIEIDAQPESKAVRSKENKVVVLSDGTTIPARRYDFKLGDWVLFKNKGESINNRVFIIVYSTLSHLVLRDLQGEELICVSNNTSNWKLVAPFNFEAEVTAREINLDAIKEVAVESGIL